MKLNNLLFLGFSVDKDYFDANTATDRFPQVAAYKYETRLIRGIRSAGVAVHRLVSVAVSTYPRNKKIFFPSRFSEFNGERSKTISIINLPFFKMASRFLSSLYYTLKWGRANSAVCVYSAHSPYLLAAVINSFLFRVPFFIFILDLPEYMNFDTRQGWLFRYLKALDIRFISAMIRQASGLIVATEHMVLDFPDRKQIPYLVVEGVAENSRTGTNSSEAYNESQNKKIIFYAGSINRAHGVQELVRGFLGSNCNAELWLCGKGDLEDYLIETEKNDSRVKYLGFITPESVATIQNSCSLLVLTRDPNKAYTRYSFPSKLLEYMASGIPVLATNLAGIPSDLRSYLNFVENFSAEAISNALNEFFLMPKSIAIERAKAGQEYILQNKDMYTQGKKIVNFMESLL